MKILCSPQAFKGSLSAHEAAQAMAEGARDAVPEADVEALPMADGGDDTLDVLVEATGGRRFEVLATGPLGEPVTAQWGVLGDAKTAVVEMARAAGLRLLRPEQYDPLRASTEGVGQIIRAALDAGYRHIVVGMGGSATVDGGTGAARALGLRFLDAQERNLSPGGAALARLTAIDRSALDPRVRDSDIRVACDVDIPLCGPRGAESFIAQKGGSPPVIRQLGAALERFARVVARDLGVNLAGMPMAGPAGGLSGGLHAFLGASLIPGAPLIMRLAGLEARIAEADLVITGEGTFDEGSFLGKGPAVVAQAAAAAAVPVIVVAGQVHGPPADLLGRGIVAVEALVDHAATVEEAQARAGAFVTLATKAALERYLRPEARV